MKKFTTTAAVLVTGLALTGCLSDADQASINLSKAAEQFEIQRRVVVYNTIRDVVLASFEGRCSIETPGKELEVVCKHGDNDYRKHFVGLSDNVSFVTTQLDPVNVSTYHTRIIWKPQSILPDVDLNISTKELNKDRY